MRFVVHLLTAVAVALAVGFGLSYYALTDGRVFGAFEVGPWSSWPDIGSPAPNPYTRAFLARTGALQLGRSEGIQFVATTDSDGQPLDRACRYRIEGTTPTATMWTLVAVDPDWVNIAAPDTPPAMHSARIARQNDGSTVVYVSRTLAPLNWLEIAGDGPFELAMTFYDAALLSGVGGSVETLPAILREACS